MFSRFSENFEDDLEMHIFQLRLLPRHQLFPTATACSRVKIDISLPDTFIPVFLIEDKFLSREREWNQCISILN